MSVKTRDIRKAKKPGPAGFVEVVAGSKDELPRRKEGNRSESRK